MENNDHKNIFVVGFAFTKDREYVLLIQKNRPSWQAGSLNGVGGHVKLKEDIHTAITREGIEETGIQFDWHLKGHMSGINNDDNKFTCHIFYTYCDKIKEAKQQEDEKLVVVPVSRIPKLKTVKNLQFLIPFGTCQDGSDYIELTYT